MNEFEGVLASAATEAQSMLGQIAAPANSPDGVDAGTVLFDGEEENKVGVFGRPQLQRVMQRGGGWTQVVFVPFVTTRDQYDSAPKVDTKLTRLSPREKYVIRDVDTHDPLNYVLLLAKTGPN